MNTAFLKRFRKCFASYDWTPAQRRYYARQWAARVRELGPRWRAIP